jgi:hypothetical protein
VITHGSSISPPSNCSNSQSTHTSTHSHTRTHTHAHTHPHTHTYTHMRTHKLRTCIPTLRQLSQVYVVAPPALIMDPALNPRDVVGMSGQRNSQPCPLRHIRKLANTCELEQQLAYVFQEGGEGEEATTIKVGVHRLLRRECTCARVCVLHTRVCVS